MLSQADTAVRSARQVANPPKPSFTLGFMIGQDSIWLPKALDILRDQLPHIHVVISTQNSPQLAVAVTQGLVDLAFLRQEDGGSELQYIRPIEEPLEVYLPKDHPLTKRSAIGIREIVNERFLNITGSALGPSGRPPALRLAIDRYLKGNGIVIRPVHEVDNLGAAMSLIESTRAVALLPIYARVFLPMTVTTRPLRGHTPKIDLSIGYRSANDSPILKLFLSRVNKLKNSQ